MKKIKSLLNMPIWTALILFGSLFPIVFVAIYNRGCADDFNYTLYTHQAVENHTSIIGAAVYTSNWFMNNWNGLYFSSFIQSLSFTIFSQKLAVINTVMIIAAIYLGLCFLSYVIFKRIGKCNDVKWFLLGAFIATYLIQTIPSPVQGLFWYNGAVSYVFAWALCMVNISVIILYLFDESLQHRKITFFAGLVLTIMTAGTHQMIEGLLLGVLLIVVIFSIITKRKREISVYFVFCIIGIVINLICPGAQTRFHDKIGSSHSWGKIFVKGIVYLIQYQIQWISVATLLLLIAAMGLAMPFIKKYAYMITGKRLLVILGICQIFVFGEIIIPMIIFEELASLRSVNIVYFTSVLGTCIISMSFVMYIYQKVHGLISEQIATENKRWILHIICMISALYIGIGTCIRVPYGSTAINALKDIMSGEAARYASELDEREQIYFSEKNESVTVKPLTGQPYSLFFGDLQNKEFWRNRSVAKYYDLESVEVE